MNGTGANSWWEQGDPRKAYASYRQMYGSLTNRTKSAAIQLLLESYDWQGKRVLEFGCGGGEFTLWLASRGAEVWAMDRNPKALAILDYAARQSDLRAQVHLLEGDAESMEVEGVFDLIFAKDILEHLADDEGFLLRVGRQTSEDGMLFLATQNNHSLNYWLEGGYQRFVRGQRGWMGWNREHLRFYNAKSLRQKMRRIGFRPQHWGSTYLIPWRFLSRRLTGKPRPWAFWGTLDLFLGLRWPFSLWGWSILVLARKQR